jgi:hypothetical protein
VSKVMFENSHAGGINIHIIGPVDTCGAIGQALTSTYVSSAGTAEDYVRRGLCWFAAGTRGSRANDRSFSVRRFCKQELR